MGADHLNGLTQVEVAEIFKALKRCGFTSEMGLKRKHTGFAPLPNNSISLVHPGKLLVGACVLWSLLSWILCFRR